MKKYLCLVFCVVFLLCGCSVKNSFYSSPIEALAEKQENKVDVNRELDVLGSGNGLVIYTAVTTDIVRGGCIMTAVMEEKDGRFRVAENGNAVFYKLSEVKQKAFSDDGWNHFVTEDGNAHYMWQWISSDNIPEDRDPAYTFKNYDFEYAGTDYGITLVLYIL